MVLPKYNIKKVHYRCDGAGCFSGHEAKAAFALWPELTKTVEEVSYKTMVPGCGKTNLDGLFGVLAMHLTRLVDSGASFKNAEELYDLLVRRPLKHTEFHLFKPQRNLIDWKVTNKIEKLSLGNFYLIKKVGDHIVRKAHSRHGKEEILHELKYFADFFHGKIDKREIVLDEMKKEDIVYELKLRGLDEGGLKSEVTERMKQALRDRIAIQQINDEELDTSKMDVHTLRFHLRTRNLPYTGNKSALTMRLNAALLSGVIADNKGE